VELETCDHTIVIGATGIVTKALKKNLEAILGKHSIHSLQKTEKTCDKRQRNNNNKDT
jgi:hypothetical protein